MSGKLKKVLGRLDGLVVQMGRFGFVHGQRVHVANWIGTDSLVVESKVVGRNKDKEKVVRLLLEGRESHNLKVISVAGMGRLGKTTLALLVYNDPRVKEYFNLSRNLLLRAMLNCGDSGSVIIVTTKSGKVATIMGTMKSYKLGCLGEEDSWSLFQTRAFSKRERNSKSWLGLKEYMRITQFESEEEGKVRRASKMGGRTKVIPTGDGWVTIVSNHRQPKWQQPQRRRYHHPSFYNRPMHRYKTSTRVQSYNHRYNW